jgi:peroxiredoxin Q/BCP
MPLVEPGRKAPAFSLPDQDGRTRRLKDYAGRPLILYFYPKDDTPGCTKETCAFRDALPDLKKGKAAVLGVSVLDTASKAKFARKHMLNFPLLADPEHEMADRYGAWQEKSLYGRTTVARRWDNVKVDGHAADALRAVDEL